MILRSSNIVILLSSICSISCSHPTIWHESVWDRSFYDSDVLEVRLYSDRIACKVGDTVHLKAEIRHPGATKTRVVHSSFSLFKPDRKLKIYSRRIGEAIPTEGGHRRSTPVLTGRQGSWTSPIKLEQKEFIRLEHGEMHTVGGEYSERELKLTFKMPGIYRVNAYYNIVWPDEAKEMEPRDKWEGSAVSGHIEIRVRAKIVK